MHPRQTLCDFISNDSYFILIFKSAFFWIAKGTMFYQVVVTLVELADHLGSIHRKVSNAGDKAILLGIANVISYLLYVVAAW